ncbi:MAG: NAD-dependent epimerase/dehydratase family protein [Thermoproteus sp.]
MEFLLFGGVGFIGVNLARRLAERGHSVVLAKRRGVPPRPLIAKALSGLRIVEYSDPAEPLRSVRPDVVVNLVAALYGSREEVERANVGFPKALCAAAREAGWRGRLIHISGATVVGPGLVKEEGKHLEGIRPATFFDKTKAEGERIVAGCFDDWIIIRPTVVYGLHNDHPEWALLTKLAKMGVAPALRLGFSAISVSDLSEVIERSSGLKSSRHYFFATECALLDFAEVLDALEEAAGRRLLRVPTPAFAARIFAPPAIRGLFRYAGVQFSCEKMKSLLGYEATYRRDDMVAMFRELWS